MVTSAVLTTPKPCLISHCWPATWTLCGWPRHIPHGKPETISTDGPILDPVFVISSPGDPQNCSPEENCIVALFFFLSLVKHFVVPDACLEAANPYKPRRLKKRVETFLMRKGRLYTICDITGGRLHQEAQDVYVGLFTY